MLLAAALAHAAAPAALVFEPPVKVGITGEPGYCYGLDHDGLGTSTASATRSAVCGTERGDVVTSTGGAAWGVLSPNGTVNEL
eukprot:COSAG04_NODE_15270_length_537_cov_1.130137_1_plen_82_part_10